jgi:hypothetical protein
MPRYHEPTTKCECGHILGHHHHWDGRPIPCRLCDCEDFISKKERAELLALIEEPTDA